MMKILVDNSGYNLDNIGDIAMLQVAVHRIFEQLPHADIHVITTSPDRCIKYCPGVIPFALANDESLEKRDLLLPAKRVLRVLRGACPRVDEYWAQWTGCVMRKLRDKAIVDMNVSQYDAVVVAGGGFFTDQFVNHALGILNTLDEAMKVGIPVFIFGNAFGPMTRPVLIQRCKEVLPRAERINIREPRESLRLLRECGVKEEAVVCTGDDALEIAYATRCDGSTSGVGINVRYQATPTIRKDRLLAIRRCLTEFCDMKAAQIYTLPISINKEHPDSRTMRCILDGLPYVAEDSIDLCRDATQVLENLKKCRIVITGSYHAAVFGLAQGKPVICLTNSPYYDSKFEGLKQIFGIGVEIVNMTSSLFECLLKDAMIKAWEMSAIVKADLLANTAEQIARSKETYILFGTSLKRRANHD